MKEKYNVTIEQEGDGYENSVLVRVSDDGSGVEAQDNIGVAVGRAVKGMMAYQNCGCAELFWLGLFKEVKDSELGGSWAREMFKRAEEWWNKACEEDGSESFDEAMMD